MKKILIVLLIVIYYNNSFSQKLCEDPIFFRKSLNKMLNYTSKRYVVNFNYKMSESLRNSVFSLSLFSDEEKQIIQEELKNSNYVPCASLLEIISSLKARALGEKNTFGTIQYSKPIYVSETKAFLFSQRTINREDFSGVGGGANRLTIYQKKDGVWKVTDKKVLEWY